MPNIKGHISKASVYMLAIAITTSSPLPTLSINLLNNNKEFKKYEMYVRFGFLVKLFSTLVGGLVGGVGLQVTLAIQVVDVSFPFGPMRKNRLNNNKESKQNKHQTTSPVS